MIQQLLLRLDQVDFRVDERVATLEAFVVVKGGPSERERVVPVTAKGWVGSDQEVKQQVRQIAGDTGGGIEPVSSVSYQAISEAFGGSLYSKRHFCAASIYPLWKLGKEDQSNSIVVQISTDASHLRTWAFSATPLHPFAWSIVWDDTGMTWAVKKMTGRDPGRNLVMHPSTQQSKSTRHLEDWMTLKAKSAARRLARKFPLLSAKAWKASPLRKLVLLTRSRNAT